MRTGPSESRRVRTQRSTTPTGAGRRPAPAGPAAPPGSFSGLDLLLALAAAALAVVVYAPSARGFFSPDDLVYLERVQHLVPPQPLPVWRFLSGPAYFALGFRVFGTDPHGWLLTNVALHALNTILLYVGVRRWGGGPLAASVAAALFGASRLWLTAVQQAVTVSELTAMTFGITAMLAATAASRSARIAAVPLFAVALLCKENVLLLPLLLIWPGFDSAPWRERAKRAAGLLAPSALLVFYLLAARAGTRTFGGDAYAIGIGPHLFHNLMTFAAWSVDLASPVPDLVTLASPTAWHVGLPVVLVLVVIAIACWRSRRLPAIGCGWWLLTLAPVLPLLRHAYLFYLYVPFAGAAMVAGVGWESGVKALTRRMSHPPPAAVVAGITAALLVGHAALSVVRLRERRAMRIEGVDLPFDPFLRKSEVARRVAEPFREAVRNGTTRAVFVLPLEGVWTFASQTGTRARAAASNPQYAVLPTVLHEGLALRALNPSVDSVAFVTRWTAAYRDIDLFTAAPDARMLSFGHGPDAHARFALVLLNARLDLTARDHLEQALAVWPNDGRLAFEHAIALGHLGDVDGERRELVELLRRDPTGPVSGPAQARLTALGPAPPAEGKASRP